MRLIDADAIKLEKGFFENIDNVPKFFEWLRKQPTIDPVKHGKWDEVTNDWNALEIRCSECGAEVPRDGWGNALRAHYCPNCGAYMQEGEEE